MSKIAKGICDTQILDLEKMFDHKIFWSLNFSTS